MSVLQHPAKMAPLALTKWTPLAVTVQMDMMGRAVK